MITNQLKNSLKFQGETPEKEVRTRAFARVLGPYIAIVTTIIAVRAESLGRFLNAFFANEALIWLTGGGLLLFGLVIIAFHQDWSNLSAILISLFGWFLALRGLTLLVAPQLIESGGSASLDMLPVIRVGFGILAFVGLWLTYIGWIANPSATEDDHE